LLSNTNTLLTGKLLSIDGLATSAIAAGEVTTLEHEVGDNTVEGGALVSEAMFSSG
jgi:hypothetical protein